MIINIKRDEFLTERISPENLTNKLDKKMITENNEKYTEEDKNCEKPRMSRGSHNYDGFSIRHTKSTQPPRRKPFYGQLKLAIV